MVNRKSLRTTAITAVLTWFVSPAVTADSQSVAGRFSATYTKQEAAQITDTAGHTIVLSVAAGSNEALQGDYMSGAQIVNRDFADLVQGTGPHQGYLTMSADAEETVTRRNGNVVTTMKGEQPMTSFKGTWETLSGTGKYASISGNGTYVGRFTSQTDYIVD